MLGQSGQFTNHGKNIIIDVKWKYSSSYQESTHTVIPEQSVLHTVYLPVVLSHTVCCVARTYMTPHPVDVQLSQFQVDFAFKLCYLLVLFTDFLYPKAFTVTS